ncbi:MAG: hypothetical protein HFG76_05445 [Hungatella sp.]|nr:hypothetical protein [Hungatella sp.]
MGIYIIFGGCIVLAVVWMLMSLPVRRTAEPGVVLAFDIAATVLVIALFGAGTYAYVGQQNRMAQEADGQEQPLETGADGKTVVPANGDIQGTGTGNSTETGGTGVVETSPAMPDSTGPTGGVPANDSQGQTAPTQVTTAPDMTAPTNQSSQSPASDGQNPTAPSQPSGSSQTTAAAPAETPAGQGVSSQTTPPSSDGAVTTESSATTAPSAPQASNP